MKNGISIMLVLLTWWGLHSCTRGRPGEAPQAGGKETILRGTLRQGEGLELMLEEMGTREYIPIDTVRCDQEGNFSIAFRQKGMAFYVLRMGGLGYLTLLLEPGENVQIKGEYGKPRSCSLEGSAGSEQLAILDAEHKRVLDELGELSRRIRDAGSLENYREIRLAIDQEMDSLTRSFRAYSIEFIEKNKPSPVILIALYNLYGRDFPVFDPRVDLGIYLRVDSLLQEAHPSLEAVRELHAQLQQLKSASGVAKTTQGLKEGEIAPDFVSSAPNGSSLALSDLRGKWVLLGFWAAWSKPSLEDAPSLKEAMDRYKDRNFTILQISFDHDGKVWKETIKEEGLDWYHVSDLEGWDSPLADLYGVERIPEYYLVEPDGRIGSGPFAANELMIKLHVLTEQ